MAPSGARPSELHTGNALPCFQRAGGGHPAEPDGAAGGHAHHQLREETRGVAQP